MTAPPRSASGHSESFTIVNDRAEIERVENRILAEVERLAYPKNARFALKLALEEALANAFRHGHRGLPADTPVRVSFTATAKGITVTIEDSGPGFNPREVPDPTLDECLAVPHGRGLMLMRAYMTSVRFNERGNAVELRYDRPQ